MINRESLLKKKKTLYAITVIGGFLAVALVVIQLFYTDPKSDPLLFIYEGGNKCDGQAFFVNPIAKNISEVEFLPPPSHCIFTRIKGGPNAIIANYPYPGIYGDIEEEHNHIKFYQLSKNNTLIEINSIDLGNIRIQSRVIFQNNLIYFSGIENNARQKIFRIDLSSKAIHSIVSSDDGFPTFPQTSLAITSQDQRYLAYEFINGSYLNENECRGACQSRNYSIWDSKTATISDIDVDIWEYALLCNLNWNPTKSILIFETGCAHQQNNQVYIYDVVERKVLKEFKAAEGQNIFIHHWSWIDSENILLWGAFDLDGDMYTGQLLYNYLTNKIQKIELPEEIAKVGHWHNANNQVAIFDPIKRNSENQITQSQLNIYKLNNSGTVEHIFSKELTSNYQSVGLLQWSKSGNWISFKADEEIGSHFTYGKLGLLNLNMGEIIYFDIDNFESLSRLWIIDE